MSSEWNAAVVYEITLDQANQINDFISNFDVSGYNMTSNNCTTFAVNALASAGISSPTSQHNWTLPDRQTIIDSLPVKADILPGGRAGIADKALNGGYYGYSPADAVQDFKLSPNATLKYGGKIYAGPNNSRTIN